MLHLKEWSDGDMEDLMAKARGVMNKSEVGETCRLFHSEPIFGQHGCIECGCIPLLLLLILICCPC